MALEDLQRRERAQTVTDESIAATKAIGQGRDFLVLLQEEQDNANRVGVKFFDLSQIGNDGKGEMQLLRSLMLRGLLQTQPSPAFRVEGCLVLLPFFGLQVIDLWERKEEEGTLVTKGDN